MKGPLKLDSICRSDHLSFTQEVKSSTLLEEDSTADEVMPALTKIGVTLNQCRARVLQVKL